jgi:uncharacterized heparinase superfamily protein
MKIAGALHRFRRLISTARYLSASQIAARAARVFRMRLLRVRGARFVAATGSRFAPHAPLLDAEAAAPERVSRARALADAADPPWHDPAITRLARYHLHYFEWVDDLAAQAALGERERAYQSFRRLVRSWLAANERIAGDGWHPYTISLRCVNWCRAASIFAAELTADAAFAEQLAGATVTQLRFLARNIEFDVRGNHIIENCRALIAGGVAFSGSEADRWLSHGLEILRREVAEQVLADGGHFERVPSYHVVVTRDLLQIAQWLRRNRDVPSWLADAVRRMLRFLDAIIMADGRLPLFKDTTYDSPDPHALLAAGADFFGDLRYGARLTLFLPQSGYAIFRPVEGASLIVDVGPPCPDYLPAHAHADMLTFELCVGGRRVVVDSGVYTYQAGEWRDYFRATRAHNTVEVEGENQSEVWSSFRVGRRAKPHAVRVTATSVSAEHDGYERLPSAVRHRRTISMVGRAVVVVDRLSGRGEVSAASFIHLHPDCDPPPVAITTFGADSERWEPSWYSERFGEKRPNRVLVLSKRARLPFTFCYVIR